MPTPTSTTTTSPSDRGLDRGKYLLPSEVDQLLAMLDDEVILAMAKGHKVPVRDAMAFRMALWSGLRASELAALVVGDLTLTRGQPPRLLVRHGKGGKAREVILPAAARGALAEYLDWMELSDYATDPEAPLLPSRSGCPITRRALWKRWVAALKRAGIPHRPLHATRHTTGLQLYRETQNMRLLQKTLGHSRPETTMIYADVLDEDIAAAQDAVWGGG